MSTYSEKRIKEYCFKSFSASSSSIITCSVFFCIITMKRNNQIRETIWKKKIYDEKLNLFCWNLIYYSSQKKSIYCIRIKAIILLFFMSSWLSRYSFMCFHWNSTIYTYMYMSVLLIQRTIVNSHRQLIYIHIHTYKESLSTVNKWTDTVILTSSLNHILHLIHFILFFGHFFLLRLHIFCLQSSCIYACVYIRNSGSDRSDWTIEWRLTIIYTYVSHETTK